ncbi:hypothetical protein Har1131_18365 [Haloarcula sp. CBA1131]|uniref:hypothetical protein n=1 Tax=Haloarcula sp. CBA1131 TaxID=1853686 RepID=UPI0012440DCC|nr:hypothetical protein [Haloarcula sp. CBA1131]KAA9400654.1 hypothetical protein Har1131_18365 [Haloarcula sp. CBA1131]
MSTTAPSFEEYDFDRGDHVRADWTEGDGPLDVVVGTVTEISRSGGNVIVAVEAADDQTRFSNSSGKCTDCDERSSAHSALP